MPMFRRFVMHGIAGGFALAACAVSVPLSAQEPERPPAATDSESATRAAVPEVVIEEIPETEEPVDVGARRAAMEEIIVIAPKPGERRLGDEFDDPVRAKLLKDFYRMQEVEEESKWREAGAKDTSSRIQVGYDPRDDYRMRNEMALQDLSWEKTKPATIFRIEF